MQPDDDDDLSPFSAQQRDNMRFRKSTLLKPEEYELFPLEDDRMYDDNDMYFGRGKSTEKKGQSEVLTLLKRNEELAPMVKCKVCGRRASEMCAKCRRTFYCSETCQKSDWEKHSIFCKK